MNVMLSQSPSSSRKSTRTLAPWWKAHLPCCCHGRRRVCVGEKTRSGPGLVVRPALKLAPAASTVHAGAEPARSVRWHCIGPTSLRCECGAIWRPLFLPEHMSQVTLSVVDLETNPRSRPMVARGRPDNARAEEVGPGFLPLHSNMAAAASHRRRRGSQAVETALFWV
ncbi:hypothetical protein LZ32DRAFT_127192 [Colletotrichum eremochloae]|nr:hypothetical protein LZ32DRAFT_127192 [Colletotrichum eremochloae]